MRERRSDRPICEARAQRFFSFDDVEHGKSSFAGDWISAEGAADGADAGSVHDLGASGDAGDRESAAKRFRCDEQVGLDAVLLASEERAGASDAGLHLVGNKEDAVLAANRDQLVEKLFGRRHEAAFAQHRLNDHSRHGFGCDDALERVFESMRALVRQDGILQSRRRSDSSTRTEAGKRRS